MRTPARGRRFKRAQTVWNEAVRTRLHQRVSNAQVSAIAPTGTIGLVMDCDTGIEPDYALVKQEVRGRRTDKDHQPVGPPRSPRSAIAKGEIRITDGVVGRARLT
ncbi:MAG: hypothetical protein R3C42_00290 [Parvularculaceae bacterium]